MKNNFLLIVSILIILGNISVNAQQKQMDSLVTEIDNDIKSLEQIKNMPMIQFSVGKSNKPFDEKDSFNFNNNQSTGKKSNEAIKTYFDSLTVYQSIYYPYKFVTFKFYEDDFAEKHLGLDRFYFNSHRDEVPKFKVNKIQYLDGTSETIDDNFISENTLEKKYSKTEVENGESYTFVDEEAMNEIEKTLWEERSGFSKTIVLYNAKPIKNFDVEVTYNLPNQLIYTLDANQTYVNTKWGKIQLISINDNEVNIILPGILDDKYTLLAQYKDGRILNQKSYNASIGLNSENLEYYDQHITVLQEAKKLIKAKKIKTTDEFSLWINANSAQEFDASKYVKEAQYNYSGPVSSVKIIVNDTVFQSTNLAVNYTLLNLDKLENFVVTDFETNKNGIIDVSGNWIVKPNYNTHFRKLNVFFYWDQIDDYSQTYWLNPATQTIQKVTYQIDDPKIFDEKFVKIETHTNGKKGLVNAKTGEIILPMEYDYIHFTNDNFWEVRLHNKKGLLDKNFKVIIPFRESQSIFFREGFIHTRWETEGQIPHWHYDVYSLKGEDITKGRFQEIDGEFDNGFMLVRTHQQKRKPEGGYETFNNQYFIIDENGTIVSKIDSEKYDYLDADNLKNKTLAVRSKKTNKYGFINMNGNEIIACQYDSVEFFFSKYALVELNDIEMLIDKNNNIIKKLPKKVRHIFKNKETNLYNFELYSNEIYDEFGKLLQK